MTTRPFDVLARGLLADLPTPEEFTELELEGTTATGVAPLPGVYVLLNPRGIPEYVGQSGDCHRRIAAHRKEGVKVFSTALVYRLEDLQSRLRLEGLLILLFAPRHNRAVNLGLANGRLWEIRWKTKTKVKPKA